ncbi:MAG: SpoIID/LytB domain-containing protein [Armatimonadetes bacterium]|nr:SpoIID/LytB domain-containing protein [Armatimonadota bacterium]
MTFLRVAVVTLGLLPVVAPAGGFYVVRVGLVSMGDPQQFTLSSDRPFGAYEAGSQDLIAQWPAMAEAAISAEGDRVRLAGRSFQAVYFSSEGPLLRLAGPARTRRYRGWIHIASREGRLQAVNEVNLETYLMGVVPCEMRSGAHPQALRAQAVACRTYVLRRMEAFRDQGFDVDDTTRCQTYRGAGAEDPRANEAIRLTSNQILVYGGLPIQALYSSVSGGVTASASEAFGSVGEPYLVSVRDLDENGEPYARGAPYMRWTCTFERPRIASLMKEAGHDVGPVRRIETVERSESGRVRQVRVTGDLGAVTLRGDALRRLLGVNDLRSTLFEISATGTGWRFDGKGWGHGVGMCQAGAEGRARAGQTYRQILAAYYVGAEVITVPGSALKTAARGSVVQRRKFHRSGG